MAKNSNVVCIVGIAAATCGGVGPSNNLHHCGGIFGDENGEPHMMITTIKLLFSPIFYESRMNLLPRK